MFYQPDFVNSHEAGATYASFEPLNAKWIERPAACNEPGIVVYTPQCSGILTWWSHVLVPKHGGELVELLAQRHHQPGVRKLLIKEMNGYLCGGILD